MPTIRPTGTVACSKVQKSSAKFALTGNENDRIGSGLKGEEAMKIPGESQPPKPITKAEREARKAFRQVEAEKAMTEHEAAQKVFSDNRERLKAERLAREAAGTPVAKTKAKPKTNEKL
jgi:hypothetical protein